MPSYSQSWFFGCMFPRNFRPVVLHVKHTLCQFRSMFDTFAHYHMLHTERSKTFVGLISYACKQEVPTVCRYLLLAGCMHDGQITQDTPHV